MYPADAKDPLLYYLIVGLFTVVLVFALYCGLANYIKPFKFSQIKPGLKKMREAKFERLFAAMMSVGLALLFFLNVYYGDMYSLRLRKTGVFWKSWYRTNFVTWSQLSNIYEMKNSKGPTLVVQAKDGRYVEIDSRIFRDYNRFIQQLCKDSGLQLQHAG